MMYFFMFFNENGVQNDVQNGNGIGEFASFFQKCFRRGPGGALGSILEGFGEPFGAILEVLGALWGSFGF